MKNKYNTLNEFLSKYKHAKCYDYKITKDPILAQYTVVLTLKNGIKYCIYTNLENIYNVKAVAGGFVTAFDRPIRFTSIHLCIEFIINENGIRYLKGEELLDIAVDKEKGVLVFDYKSSAVDYASNIIKQDLEKNIKGYIIKKGKRKTTSGYYTVEVFIINFIY